MIWTLETEAALLTVEHLAPHYQGKAVRRVERR